MNCSSDLFTERRIYHNVVKHESKYFVERNYILIPEILAIFSHFSILSPKGKILPISIQFSCVFNFLFIRHEFLALFVLKTFGFSSWVFIELLKKKNVK